MMRNSIALGIAFLLLGVGMYVLRNELHVFLGVMLLIWVNNIGEQIGRK